MKRIDNLNGYGVGASDVFVALVADNPHLVRCVGDETMAPARGRRGAPRDISQRRRGGAVSLLFVICFVLGRLDG